MATKLPGASISFSRHPPFTKNSSCKMNLTSGILIQRKFQVPLRISMISCCSDMEAPSTNSRSQNKRPLTTIDLTGSLKDGAGIRVAYQGVSGAYSESAAEKAYPNCETVPCEQFDIAFQAVEKWIADRAVLPIENSLGGSIHRNYDLLLRHRLHIVGEVQLSVRHCLLANHGVKIENLKRVLSHPQALAQCEHRLTSLRVVREAADDTAGAAQFVALHKLKDTGAVASIGAAKIYNLNVLAQDIQDDSDNITRFLMLAREPIIPGTDRPFKTSIVFSLDEGPGMLYKALAVFSMRDINLTKIESRPQRKRPLLQSVGNRDGLKHFDYLFYCDFEASMADQNAQNALKHLKEFATLLRVLGSYPMDMNLMVKVNGLNPYSSWEPPNELVTVTEIRSTTRR